MALPINIDELLRGSTVENERIEFKESWDPEDVLHTMCAFANDMNNWGGGYIIIGVRDVDGRAELPPKGLYPNQIDSFQKKVVELGHKVNPNYFPVLSPYIISGKQILVIWCPAGDNRPYTVPISLSEKRSDRAPYIRVGSETKRSSNEQQRRLYELAARIPFDDRINAHATLNDLDLGLMRTYLYEVKSQLYDESARVSVKDLAVSMLIAKGPEEDVRPTNVGLMFFSKDPEKFFPRCRIEVVIHKDKTGRNFEEMYFQGPIHDQLRNVLSFIKNQVIKEHVIKRADVAEADRFYNYPYQALEEVLANAVYHRSYEKQEPIEVQIWDDRIEVLSFPGPVPPVDYDTLRNLNERKRIIAREYRNRRVGDFLKELDLTEGRGTGFPTIYGALALNGSPIPYFETDKELNYFLSIIYARQEKVISSADKGVSSTDKGASSADKGASSADKGASSADKGASSTDKGASSADKAGSSAVKAGSSAVKEGSSAVKEGSSAVKEGSSAVKEGSSAVKEGSSAVKEGSSADKGVSSTDKGVSSTDKGASSADKGASSADRSGIIPEKDVANIRELLGERTANRELLECVILYVCSFGPMDLKEIADYISRNERYLYASYVLPMINNDLLSREYKDATHPFQRYLLTSQGKEVLKKAEKLLMLESKNKKID